MTGGRFAPLALAALTAAVLVIDLGGQYVWSKDEARGALVAREMLEGGHWLIPHIGGNVYPDKPPLYHWTVALASPHGVTAWSLRVPSVLAAAATVALTYAMGARLGPPLAGLVAATALASSAALVQWGRSGRLDMLLVLWLTLALWSALRWLEDGSRRHATVLGVALGLGWLTKGPVALLPLLMLLIAVTLLRRWSRRAVADLARAAAVAIALPAAWLVAAALAHDGLRRYLEQILASFGSEIRTDRNQRPLFALEEIGAGFLPWTVVLPGTALVVARRWRTSRCVLALPLLWIVLVGVVFTAALSPRAVYFLPIYPALAVVVGWAWAMASPGERRWMLWPLLATMLVTFVVALGLVVWPQTLELKRQLTVLDRGVGALVAALAGATLIGVMVLLGRGRGDALPMVAGAGALLVSVALHVTVHTPRDNRAYPTREVAAFFDATLPPDARVVYLDRKFLTALMFYMRRLGQEVAPAAIVEHGGLPGRYALVPEEMVTHIRDRCPYVTAQAKATFVGGGYTLLAPEAIAPGCER